LVRNPAHTIIFMVATGKNSDVTQCEKLEAMINARHLIQVRFGVRLWALQ
jgi:hypothetical protein